MECRVDTRDLYQEDAALCSCQAGETEKGFLYYNRETRMHPLWLEQGVEGMTKAFFFFFFPFLSLQECQGLEMESNKNYGKYYFTSIYTLLEKALTI